MPPTVKVQFVKDGESYKKLSIKSFDQSWKRVKIRKNTDTDTDKNDNPSTAKFISQCSPEGERNKIMKWKVSAFISNSVGRYLKYAAKIIPFLAIFLNIYLAVCGAAYLCECRGIDQSFMTYALFPIMIFLRIAFPTNIFVNRLPNLGIKVVTIECSEQITKKITTACVSFVVLCLPFIIHAGMAVRSDGCHYLSLKKTHFFK